MPFLARVEIHNADLPTYYRLHAAMEAESFKRVITGANDFKQYRMPLGTYWTDAFEDSWEAFNAAQRAALPIDETAQVILCGAGPILFQNCRQHVEEPILGLHSVRQTEPHQPAQKPRQIRLAEPIVPEPRNIPPAEPYRPVPKAAHVPQPEPSLPELRNISQPQGPRPVTKAVHVPLSEPSVAGPQSTSPNDPYGAPPAPTPVPRPKHSLAGLRGLFQTDPYGTPPTPTPVPQGKHPHPGAQAAAEGDPYGSLPRRPVGALKGYGTR